MRKFLVVSVASALLFGAGATSLWATFAEENEAEQAVYGYLEAIVASEQLETEVLGLQRASRNFVLGNDEDALARFEQSKQRLRTAQNQLVQEYATDRITSQRLIRIRDEIQRDIDFFNRVVNTAKTDEAAALVLVRAPTGNESVERSLFLIRNFIADQSAALDTAREAYNEVEQRALLSFLLTTIMLGILFLGALLLGYRWYSEKRQRILYEGQVRGQADLATAQEKLKETAEDLRYTIELHPQVLWTARPDGSTISLSGLWESITGLKLVDHEWYDALHPEDRDKVHLAWLETARKGREWDTEYRLNCRGEYRWFRSHARPRFENGSVYRYYGVLSDIHEEKMAKESLKRAEENLRLTIELHPQMLWTASGDGKISSVSPKWHEATGLAPEVDWKEALHPEDKAETVRLWQEAVQNRAPSDIKFRVRVNGEYRWHRSRSQPAFNDDGSVHRYYGVLEDIHEEEMADERQKLLVEELNHRVKNTLSTVQSLALQTKNSAISILGLEPGSERYINAQTFFGAFQSRLMSLSHTYNILSRDLWEPVALKDIILSTIQPLVTFDRVDTSELDENLCSVVRLSPNAAVTVNLVFHELTTNAIKYGALSVPSGTIKISCSRADDNLTLVWQEQGGPRVSPPTRRGFGSKLIERSAMLELKGKAQIEYNTSGVRCTIKLPNSTKVYISENPNTRRRSSGGDAA